MEVYVAWRVGAGPGVPPVVFETQAKANEFGQAMFDGSGDTWVVTRTTVRPG